MFTDQQKHEFEEIVSYFKSNVDPLSKDLAFLLGFFVKEVVSRWWRQYTRLPSPDTLAMQMHGLVVFDDKESEALQFSHSVMRYVILSYVLSVRRVSSVSRIDFKNYIFQRNIFVVGCTKYFPQQ